jgi:hypothetical protein
MSANIYWSPVQNKGVEVPMGTPSEFISALDLPRKFDLNHMEFLRGISAGRRDWQEAIAVIQEAIVTHGEIQVYAEY